MRARNVKPSFFQNEQLAELPFEARLLFVGLWCMADREGRLEDRPKRIKMNVFPADSIDIVPLLDGLESQGLIERYEAQGIACIYIPKFVEHQRPHQNEQPSKLPTKVASASHQGTKDFALNPSSLIPDSLNPLPLGESAQQRAAAPVAVTETPSAESRKDRATRIPADFVLTPERRVVAVAERLDPERTFAKFCNHWQAKGGQAARKVDWEATWRNWCMEDADRSRRNGAPAGERKTRFEQMQEVLRDATES